MCLEVWARALLGTPRCEAGCSRGGRRGAIPPCCEEVGPAKDKVVPLQHSCEGVETHDQSDRDWFHALARDPYRCGVEV